MTRRIGNQGIALSQYQWDDVRVNLASVRGGSYTSYKGGSVLTLPNAGITVSFDVQLPHSYRHGTDLQPHIHIVYPNANAGNVEITFTYSWANVDEAFPAQTSDTKVFAATGVADTQHIYGFDDPVGTGKQISSVLICSVTRSSGGNDTYASDVYVVGMDFHYLMDTNGSRIPIKK